MVTTRTSRISDWFQEQINEFRASDKNPWQSRQTSFGEHYLELAESPHPAAQAEAAQIREWANALYLRVLARYPELVVSYRTIPPEENGFLKFLDLQDRISALGADDLNLSVELKEIRDQEKEWDPMLFRAWLDQNQSLLDELLDIGLTEKQSVNGIDIERYYFVEGTIAINACDVLLLNARLSLDEGDTEAALQSVRAARGLADHLTEVELPTLLQATLAILMKLSLGHYVRSELIPAVPQGELDISAWEEATRPQLTPPAELARTFLGEWHIIAQKYIFPGLADGNDPKYPPDPLALIDYEAIELLRLLKAYHSTSPTDWPSSAHPGIASYTI